MSIELTEIAIIVMKETKNVVIGRLKWGDSLD